MRKARFTEEQTVAIIREVDREPGWVVAKRHGISERTIYTWRRRFGRFQASDVRRLKQLEAENRRLKKLVAASVGRSNDPSSSAQILAALGPLAQSRRRSGL
jgi:putative transposase